MTVIPVTLTAEGKDYQGKLTEVAGAAGRMWHLYIDNFYFGQVVMTENNCSFHGNRLGQKFECQSGYFENVLICWYQ